MGPDEKMAPLVQGGASDLVKSRESYGSQSQPVAGGGDFCEWPGGEGDQKSNSLQTGTALGALLRERLGLALGNHGSPAAAACEG